MLDSKYLSGALNIVADMESRRSFQDIGNWHLNLLDFSKDLGSLAPEYRSIRVALERPVAGIGLLASRSIGMDDRCLLTQLEVHQGLCVPSIQSNRELYPEDEIIFIFYDLCLYAFFVFPVEKLPKNINI